MKTPGSFIKNIKVNWFIGQGELVHLPK